MLVFAHSEGRGLADAYAPLAADVLGVRVDPHDAAIPYLTPDKALHHLDGTFVPAVGDLVRESEILNVAVGIDLELVGGWGDAGDAHGPRGTVEQAPPVPTDEEIATALEGFDAELTEIVLLRRGEPTVLFGFAQQLGQLVRWQELGIDDACMSGYEAIFAEMAEIAEAHGGTMVYLIDVFHGPNRDRDPRADGLVDPDGTHWSDEGAKVAAQAFASLPIESTPLLSP